jgi:hypothetical protein
VLRKVPEQFDGSSNIEVYPADEELIRNSLLLDLAENLASIKNKTDITGIAVLKTTDSPPPGVKP